MILHSFEARLEERVDKKPLAVHFATRLSLSSADVLHDWLIDIAFSVFLSPTRSSASTQIFGCSIHCSGLDFQGAPTRDNADNVDPDDCGLRVSLLSPTSGSSPLSISDQVN